MTAAVAGVVAAGLDVGFEVEVDVEVARDGGDGIEVTIEVEASVADSGGAGGDWVGVEGSFVAVPERSGTPPRPTSP